MITTAVIAFREFLEAFLLIGIFFGLNSKLGINRQKEILSAAIIGTVVSFMLPVAAFLFSSKLHGVLTEKNADIIEGYLLIFSGFFLAYVIFSLHAFMRQIREKRISTARDKLKQNIFDISLFVTIVFFIVREGFEVTLLTATVSIFSVFGTNFIGLLIGFAASGFVGLASTVSFITFPVKYVFKYTEYLIILLGASMVKNGVSLLIDRYTPLKIEDMVRLPLHFIPPDTTIPGHILKTLFGLEPKLSILQVIIMVFYCLVIYYLWLRKENIITKR